MPIASVAKVMTAYLVLRTRPAADKGADEPTLHVSADDVADTERLLHDPDAASSLALERARREMALGRSKRASG